MTLAFIKSRMVVVDIVEGKVWGLPPSVSLLAPLPPPAKHALCH